MLCPSERLARAASSLLALSLLPLAAHAQGNVLTVDAAGAGQYTRLEQALADANSDDVVLVFPGDYSLPVDPFSEAPEFVLDAGLTVVAAEPGVTLSTRLVVRDLPAGRTALIQGVEFSAPSDGLLGTPESTYLLGVENCAGAVRFQSCSILQSAPHFAPVADPLGWHTVQISDSDNVKFSDCALVGGASSSIFAVAESTSVLKSVNSRVLVWHGTIDGAANDFGLVAGPAILLENSTLSLIGTEVNGIDGAIQFGTACATDGGHAVRADATSTVELQAATLSGGAAGVGGGAGSCPDTFDGASFDPTSPAAVDLPGDAPRFSADRQAVQVGQTFQTTVEGEPGSFLLLGLGRAEAPVYFSEFQGYLGISL
ncbi:MAG: hypothetical protein ACYS26_21270, partial [Planctomycetota bacterium]